VPNTVLVSTADCPASAERPAAADAAGAVELITVTLDGEKVLQWVVHPNLLHPGEQIVIEAMLADAGGAHPHAGFGMLPYLIPPACIPMAHRLDLPAATSTK
jgi:hypothetical protein